MKPTGNELIDQCIKSQYSYRTSREHVEITPKSRHISRDMFTT